MIKVFCDRCKKEVDESSDLNLIQLKTYSAMDLGEICEDCFEILEKWIKGKNETRKTKKH
jgi:hypothetical protein